MTTNKAGKWVLNMLLWFWTGTIYFFVEVAWKTAHSNTEAISWTMLLLAIFLAIPLERCGAEVPWEMPMLAQAAICTGIITAAEFVAGCILNIWLGLGIWDYSDMTGNVLGQVCPQFIVIWFFFSMLAIVMLDYMRYCVEGGEKPHYKLI